MYVGACVGCGVSSFNSCRLMRLGFLQGLGLGLRVESREDRLLPLVHSQPLFFMIGPHTIQSSSHQTLYPKGAYNHTPTLLPIVYLSKTLLIFCFRFKEGTSSNLKSKLLVSPLIPAIIHLYRVHYITPLQGV